MRAEPSAAVSDSDSDADSANDDRLDVRTWRSVDPRPGPSLVLLGGVHGDEPCGTIALDRLTAELTSGTVSLERGTLTIVARANPLACRLGTRQGERNLNRSFVPTTTPADYEDRIVAQLAPVLAAHEALVDLHSFSSPGEPFAMIGPRDNEGSLEPFALAKPEAALAGALGLGVVVEGWLDVYAARVAARGAPSTLEALAFGIGTNEHMRRAGGYAVTVECGQHAEPDAARVAYRIARLALAHLGMAAAVPDGAAPSRGTRAPRARVLRTAAVVDREHAADAFVRPLASFDAVHAGEVVARRADGSDLVVPVDGAVMFPDPHADVGEEWFYLATASERRLG